MLPNQKVVTVKISEASAPIFNEDRPPYTFEDICQIEKRIIEVADIQSDMAVEVSLLVALKILERVGLNSAELVVGDTSLRVNIAEASPKPAYYDIKLTTEPKIK